jgi:hypothetical protein
MAVTQSVEGQPGSHRRQPSLGVAVDGGSEDVVGPPDTVECGLPPVPYSCVLPGHVGRGNDSSFPGIVT